MTHIVSLIGTPAKLTIIGDNGRIIIREGEIITPGVIRSATAAGRIQDLQMAAEMGHAPKHIEPVPEYEEIGEEEPVGVHPE